ncbi:MAG: ExbD/TolR family protein [Burkholderiales bacterium]|nr:ExbD/TolR family protein [Burkholderiales bacterium]
MRRQRKSINQINVVPYIDVMLVLLVIFMVTAPLITPGEIELPSIGGAPKAPDQPLELTLGAKNTLSLRDTRTGQTLHGSLADLTETLVDKQRETAQPVVIAASKDARYEDVIAIVDGLQRAGVKRVGLLARPTTK